MKIFTLKIYVAILVSLIAVTPLTAQDFSTDYKWSSLDRLQIVTCRDDGFACLSHSIGGYQNHAVIKFNADGKSVFRYEAEPEKMFGKFIKKGATYQRKMFELSNGNLIVWFSAAKENRCPIDLYYYILSPAGKLLTAANVPFEKYKARDIENPALDDVVMVNDNEFVLSVKHGGSCKEIFNNSPINKNFLFNINTGSITALHDLNGHRVVNCIAGNNSIYLLTLPVRFYRNDEGIKTEAYNSRYNLWKFTSSFQKQQHVTLWQYPENNTYMQRMMLQGDILKVFFCQRAFEDGEFGYQEFDVYSLYTGRKKSYKTQLYPHDVYAAHDKYFLQGSTVITDATGDDMIFFHVEAAKKSGYGDDRTIHAQVVQDGVIRNEKMLRVLEEKRLFAVSQPNSKGTYLMGSSYTPRNFMGNFFTDPLLVYSYDGIKLDAAERKEQSRNVIEAMKTRFVKLPSIPQGTPLLVAEMDKKDFYAVAANNTQRTVVAGTYLMRRGDGYYTGYITDENGKSYFVYGARFFPSKGIKKSVNNSAKAADDNAKKTSANPKVPAEAKKKSPATTAGIKKGKSKLPTNKLSRSRPYTFRILNETPLWGKPTFNKLFAESLLKQGLIQADIDSIYTLVNKMPLVADETDDQIAALWKAYIVAETYGDYLVWVPRDENLDMEEDYIPNEPDGFFVSMAISYSNPNADQLAFAERKRRRLNDPSVPGPKRAIMDGETKYLDGLSRKNSYTISKLSDKLNTAMNKSSYHYFCWDEMKGLGLNRAQIDKIGNILNNLPLPINEINDKIAEQWKAYIIVGTSNNYLVWIPQDENMHMPEEYRPKDPDGFAVFVFK